MIATKDEVQSLARHALTGLGLWLVQMGVVRETGIVESLGGVAFIVAGLVWSWLDKRQKRKQLEAARAEMPPGAVMLPLAATPMPAAGACAHCGRGGDEA